jgi:hypothetical protein
MASYYDSLRTYNVYDAIRARSRARRQASKLEQAVVDQATGQAEGSLRPAELIPDGGMRTTSSLPSQTGNFASPFMSDTRNYGAAPGTGVVDLATNPELRAVEGMQFMSNPKAAAKSDLGYYGPYDPSSVLGKALNTAMGVIDPTPFGLFGGLLSGTTTVDPYGKTVSKPVGMLGKVSEFMTEKHYEVANQIKNKTPGHHQFYSGGQLVSIVPQTIFGKQIGYTTLGPGDLPADVAIKQYAAMMGYDPNTVDLSKTPGQKGFGVELEAFVPGTGGFTQQGSFVNVAGDEVSQLGPGDLESQLGLVADIYGIDTAMKALSTAKISDEVRSSLTDALSAGQLTAKAITDNKGNVVGYDTGIGSVVTSASGIVTSGSGAPVTSGYGIMSTEMYDSRRRSLKMTSQEEDRVEGRTEADATLEDVLGFDPGLDWSGGEGAGPTTVEQTPTIDSPVVDSKSDNNDRGDSDPTGASDGFGIL